MGQQMTDDVLPGEATGQVGPGPMSLIGFGDTGHCKPEREKVLEINETILCGLGRSTQAEEEFFIFLRESSFRPTGFGPE
jgi:hypothetical protein